MKTKVMTLGAALLGGLLLMAVPGTAAPIGPGTAPGVADGSMVLAQMSNRPMMRSQRTSQREMMRSRMSNREMMRRKRMMNSRTMGSNRMMGSRKMTNSKKMM